MLVLVVLMSLVSYNQAQTPKQNLTSSTPNFIVTYTFNTSLYNLQTSVGDVQVYFNSKESVCLNSNQPTRNNVINNGGSNEVKVAFSDSEQSAVYINNPKRQVVFKVYSPIAFENVIHDTLPPINWVIKEDYKTIAGKKCQKATCLFGGRNYEAWFSKALPYNIGPYKFRDLPGLIMSIKSTDGVISYEFKSFESNKNPKNKIIAPKQTTKFTSYSSADFRKKSAQGAIEMQKALKAEDIEFSPSKMDCFIEKTLEWW